MANDEHVAILEKGVGAWNKWRREKSDLNPDLSGVNLIRAQLWGADLTHANLVDANLGFARLNQVDLTGARLLNAKLNGVDLLEANLSGADLTEANLTGVDLTGANLSGVNLTGANLTGAALTGVDLTGARLAHTLFALTNLIEVKGLDRCYHAERSIIDFQTLEGSDRLPVAFLRGVGLPDHLIKYLSSLRHEAIPYYSCFISYSSKDQAFADRLHEDLQNKGVRCWFAPDHMRIGDKIVDTLDQAIRRRDKVLLILSEEAIASDWVEDEVTTAFEEERKRKEVVLFPVRLDDAVKQTSEAWAAKLRARHIGDFRRWKEHDSYQKSFERLMRDLRVEKPGQ